MVSLLCRLIIAKRRKFSTVPVDLREAVQLELLRQGYDTDGNRVEVKDENSADANSDTIS